MLAKALRLYVLIGRYDIHMGLQKATDSNIVDMRSRICSKHHGVLDTQFD
jgi:hypothetical protein